MKQKRMQRMLCALLCVWTITAALALSPSACLAEGSGVVVRVLLTNLQLTNRLDLSLDGSYTLQNGDMAFQRGSRVTAFAQNGAVMLYYEGMALSCGSSVTFVRHAVLNNEENGLRLNNGYNLFTGDLTLSVRDGMLRAVLHAPMEEYLLGVVPYEMSDSFPEEALKAQAVAARTYAMRKVGGKQDYDIADNTNDQVYRGYNAQNTRAVKAVKETAGLCGYYKGGLAECYYTASNGGQTELVEHVWAKGDYGYIDMRDDPYDVANPASSVKSVTLDKTPKDGVIGSQALTAQLLAGATEQLTSMGYDGENIQINKLVSLEARDPQYAQPSKLMKTLRFGLSMKARRVVPPIAEDDEDTMYGAATNAPKATAGQRYTVMMTVPETCYVDIDIFGTFEPMFSLSINGGNNELYTVTESERSFTVSARRYGHGVGMSQRGAEQMAQAEGWTYRQILAFYYPGVTLKTVATAVTPRPVVNAAFLATPGPPATPTPRPTLMPVSATPGKGQWLAKVTQIATNSSLNMRDEPGMTGTIVRVLYYGQELLVLNEEPDGWLHVRTDALEGYVMAKFVEKVE